RGGLGTARDCKGPFYGAFHLRLKIPLVNVFGFCRDSLLGIGLIASKKAALCSAAKFGAGYAFQSLAGKSFTRCRTLIACKTSATIVLLSKTFPSSYYRRQASSASNPLIQLHPWQFIINSTHNGVSLQEAHCRPA